MSASGPLVFCMYGYQFIRYREKNIGILSKSKNFDEMQKLPFP